MTEALKFGVVVLFVWIAGQIVTQGVSDEYATRRPALAVAWRADSPDALTALAQSRLAAHDLAHAAGLARRALAGSPLNVAAMSTFAFALDEAGDGSRAASTMRFAGTRGWRDALTQVWLMAHWLRERRYDLSFERADALLRRGAQFQPEISERLAPAVLQSLVYVADHDPRAIPPLADRLALSPAWRELLLNQFANGPDPASKETDWVLLRRLAGTATPPSNAEVAALVNGLVRDQKYSEAAMAWRQLSPNAPAAEALVIDGDFDHARGIGPFGWSLSQGVGWLGSIDPAPGRGHGQALRLEYDGFSPPRALRQLLVLPPGEYRLSGEIYQEAAGAETAPYWTVVCVRQSARALSTRPDTMAASGRWTSFDTGFSVAPDCPAQWLQLTAERAEDPADSITWYDDLAINQVHSPK